MQINSRSSHDSCSWVRVGEFFQCSFLRNKIQHLYSYSEALNVYLPSPFKASDFLSFNNLAKFPRVLNIISHLPPSFSTSNEHVRVEYVFTLPITEFSTSIHHHRSLRFMTEASAIHQSISLQINIPHALLRLTDRYILSVCLVHHLCDLDFKKFISVLEFTRNLYLFTFNFQLYQNWYEEDYETTKIDKFLLFPMGLEPGPFACEPVA